MDITKHLQINVLAFFIASATVGRCRRKMHPTEKLSITQKTLIYDCKD